MGNVRKVFPVLRGGGYGHQGWWLRFGSFGRWTHLSFILNEKKLFPSSLLGRFPTIYTVRKNMIAALAVCFGPKNNMFCMV